MAKHAVVWASVGAGVGCGVAIPLLRFWPVVQAMVTGAVGGLAAAICYESLLGVFFPLESTDILFPTQPANRLVLFCLNGVLIGGFLGLVLTPRAARPQSHAGAR
ncbi:MAG TPA: hypothetical protein VG826_26970 [Pirellulales bacterium]|nr:hypothetical protein [Pirellulales bacterium]